MSSKPLGAERPRFTSIPGFSDQREMPRIAKLRLGIRDAKGTSKEHPRETDHFVLDVENSVAPEAAKEIRARFHALYTERPQVITNVRLLSSNREEAFSSSYEWWRAGKLFCHGNGNQALRKIEGQWQDWTASHPCANGGCPDFGSKKCGLISRLRFMLPDVTVSGYFQVDTGSVYSTANIRNGLNIVEALAGMAQGGGVRLTTVPLTLVRAPQKIEFEGKLNEHFILHLQPQNYTLDSLKEIAGTQKLIPAGATIPDVEDDLPAELIADSEQQPAEELDSAKQAFIDEAIPLLRWNDGTQAGKRAQFPRQADLYTHVVEQVDRAITTTFESLKMPGRDEKALREQHADSKLALLAEVIARWNELPPDVKKARKAGAA